LDGALERNALKQCATFLFRGSKDTFSENPRGIFFKLSWSAIFAGQTSAPFRRILAKHFLSLFARYIERGGKGLDLRFEFFHQFLLSGGSFRTSALSGMQLMAIQIITLRGHSFVNVVAMELSIERLNRLLQQVVLGPERRDDGVR